MSEQQDSAKRMRFTSDFVTIKATLNEQTETFRVHEDVIKKRTEYFRAAFDRKWQEGKAREIEMHEEHPRTISSYLEFVYSKSLASTLPETERLSEDDEGMEHLMRLYVFGEKIQDDEFCDEVVHTLATRCTQEDEDGKTWFPGLDAIHILYNGTPSNSPARRFLVDMYVEHGDKTWLEEEDDSVCHPEYALDLVRALTLKMKDSEYRSPASQVHKWLKGQKEDALDSASEVESSSDSDSEEND